MIMESRPQPNILSQSLGNHSLITTIGANPGERGPWSLVSSIPNSDVDMLGPSPEYLSVAAWAA